MDAILGQIILWPVSWIPEGWMPCDGTKLPVREYQALYSILGNTFGGDYHQFALPDFRGRVPVGANESRDHKPNYRLGETGGEAQVKLTSKQIMDDKNVTKAHVAADPANELKSVVTIDKIGGGEAYSNMQPYLAMHYIIAVNGDYPVRRD